jgi:SAM-dependent methyltransferase
VIRPLEPVLAPDTDEPPAGLAAGHPMREVTRAVAFDPDAWTDERRLQVAALFDSLAPEWNSRGGPGREAPLRDALDRGLAAAPPASRRTCLDIGAGTGLYSDVLTARFDVVWSVDLAGDMLRLAPPSAAVRVQADASRLPVPDGSVDVLVLANCFLFPREVPRVLGSRGVVVWVSSRGADTPIHLTAEEVDQVLPGAWDGVASRAGWGTWSVHWRAPDPEMA